MRPVDFANPYIKTFLTLYTSLFPFVYHFYNYNVFKMWKDGSQERLKKKPVMGPGQRWEVEGWTGIRTKTCWRLAEANPQDESLPWSSSGSRPSRYDLEPGCCLEIFRERGTLRVKRERITLLAWGQNMLETQKPSNVPWLNFLSLYRR